MYILACRGELESIILVRERSVYTICIQSGAQQTAPQLQYEETLIEFVVWQSGESMRMKLGDGWGDFWSLRRHIVASGQPEGEKERKALQTSSKLGF